MSARFTIRRKAAPGPQIIEEEREGKTAATEAESLALQDDDLRAIKQMVVYYEKIANYMYLRNKLSRLIFLNLISGMAKGFGIALGITVIAFLALQILNSLEILNLPISGDFIAELIDYIQSVQNIV